MSTISVSGSSTVSSASTSSYVVQGGGTLVVAAGGSVSGTQVQSGGTLTVSSGGSATGGTISAGAIEQVYSGGVVSGDTIYGTVSGVSTGATTAFRNETVMSGGVLAPTTSNTVSGTTINGGGNLILNGNISATNTVLSGGGLVALGSPKATLLGSLTFSGGNNTLSVTSVVTTSTGTYGEAATISGFSSTDRIDATVFGPTATLAFTTSNSNEVVTISSTAGRETFTFSGTTTYTGSTLDLVATGGAEYIEYFANGVTSVTTSTASGAYSVGSGQDVNVGSGGSVTGATVGSGGLLQVRGGTETGATISVGGTEAVWSGSASGDQIYGLLATLSGGTAVLANETVNSGGALLIANGASATGTTVLSGGVMTLSGANGAVTSTTLSGGGTLVLASTKASLSGGVSFAGGNNTLSLGAVASTGTIGSAVMSGFSGSDKIDVSIFGAGAHLTVSGTDANGNEVFTVTNSAGTTSETITFAGSTSYTASTLQIISAGAAEYIEYNSAGWPTGTVSSLSAGTTSGVTVANSSTVYVPSGAHAVSATVQSGGTLVLTGGSDLLTTVQSGGIETLSSGAATGDIVSGTLTVSGGTASATSVASGGTIIVAGGTLSASTVAQGGTETINSGQASGDIISGTLTVNSGSESSATIASGGVEMIKGGQATQDAIYGSATVSSGARAYGEIVETGGTMTVLSGAVVSGTTVQSGGTEVVSGGTIQAELIHGTVSTISKGTGVFTGETVASGGTLYIANGNTASGTNVLSGGVLNLSGNNGAVTATTLAGGGTLMLESPKANISGTLTFFGGHNTLRVDDFATAGYGDQAVISGFSTSDAIDVTIFGNGATLSFATNAGGNEVVTISSTSGTESFIFAGSSTYTSNTVGLAVSAGREFIEYSQQGFNNITTQVTTSTIPQAFTETATNTLLVLSGGSVTSATIDNGAFLVVSGGTDTAATIITGGTETVSTGSASGDQISGITTVLGGTVTNETVLSGGVLSVGSGASVANVALTSGGRLDLAAATATVTGAITLSGGSNTIEAAAVAQSGHGDLAIISGFTSSDQVKVDGISASGATLSFATDSNNHEVVTVSGTGGSQTFTFADPSVVNANTLGIATDGNGLDLVLKTTPTISFTSLGGFTNQASTIVNGHVDVASDPGAIGQTVSVISGSSVLATATVGSDGFWHANVTFPSTNGTTMLTASVTDRAGQTGTTSQSLSYMVNTAAAAFTPGNLVISISGDGDGSGIYGDNQGTPMVLEQITTAGSYVSQMVMPQATTVVNGVTEYVISSEYGSSSEGTIQRSADGHSLVIAGYGINANTYNAGGAAVYGNAALAQTTSVPGGQYTAVARVIADINAVGTIDTSTALYNVFNTQNPRSVNTVDGSAFWISGQGIKASTNQGVFYTTDGSSSATAIYTASDTRTAIIYNGELYVSADSTQIGGAAIEAYSGLPTSATTPTVLAGMGHSVVLNGSNGNSVNGGMGTVALSPENFFFANATTLYVADGGTPKEGGLGDGGLQKWSLINGSWQLDYTLSAGLNLVPNSSTSGSTGLIGLTGQVVGNSVQLYATNELVTDLGATGVYAITDQLDQTSAPANESFTEIFAASAGENIRGVTFAPSGYTPTISGTVAGQTTTNNAAIKPFASSVITDQNSASNANIIDTLTIRLSGGGGALSGSGLVTNSDGSYTLTGSAAAVTAELEALTFTPNAQANTTVTTSFSLLDTSSAVSATASDTTTSVVDTVAAISTAGGTGGASGSTGSNTGGSTGSANTGGSPTGVGTTNTGNAEDGYLVGATVGYLDVAVYQQTGQIKIDTTQPTTTTGANGSYTLAAWTGTGTAPPVVLTGGTDSTTGLAFTGSIEAPNGSAILSPLTTLVYQIAQSKGDTSAAGIAAANASLVSSLGLQTGTDLTTLDAQAGATAGNAAATAVFLAEATVASLAKLVQSAGSTTTALYTTIASTIASGGSVNLTSASGAAALAAGAGLSGAAANAIGSVVAATASALNSVLASATSASATFNAIVGASLALQQTAAQSIANAATSSDPTAAFTSAASTYTHAVNSTLTSAINTSASRNSGTGWGDVHMVTFEGLHYNFNAVGDYTLVQSTVAGNAFDVQIRTAGWADMVSVTTEIAAQVGANTVDFTLDGTVKVNGVADASLAQVGAIESIDGGVITRTGSDSYEVDWATGESLGLTNVNGQYFNETATLSASDGPGSVKGLLGSNTSQATDIALSDGTVLHNPSDDDLLGAFAQSWSLGGGGSLLDGGGHLPTPMSNLGNQTTPFNGKASVDLSGFAATATTIGFSEDQSGGFGTLTVTSGSHQTALILMGQYAAADFHAANDGHGGTVIDYQPPKPALLG